MKIGGQVEATAPREVPTEGETLKLQTCEFVLENLCEREIPAVRSLLEFVLP